MWQARIFQIISYVCYALIFLYIFFSDGHSDYDDLEVDMTE